MTKWTAGLQGVKKDSSFLLSVTQTVHFRKQPENSTAGRAESISGSEPSEKERKTKPKL